MFKFNKVLAILLGTFWISNVLAADATYAGGGWVDKPLKFEPRVDCSAELRKWFELDEEEKWLTRELGWMDTPRDCGSEPQFAYGGCMQFAVAVGGEDSFGGDLDDRFDACIDLIGSAYGVGALDLYTAKEKFGVLEREYGSDDIRAKIVGEQVRLRQAYEDWYDCLGREEMRPKAVEIIKRRIERLAMQKKLLDYKIIRKINAADAGVNDYEDAEWYPEDGFDFLGDD